MSAGEIAAEAGNDKEVEYYYRPGIMIIMCGIKLGMEWFWYGGCWASRRNDKGMEAAVLTPMHRLGCYDLFQCRIKVKLV